MWVLVHKDSAETENQTLDTSPPVKKHWTRHAMTALGYAAWVLNAFDVPVRFW